MEPFTKIIELNTNSCFCDVLCDDVIHGLLANGYVLNITPCKYNDDKYTVMIEIGEIDDSFIPHYSSKSKSFSRYQSFGTVYVLAASKSSVPFL